MTSHRQVFLQNMAQTTPFPMLLEIEKASGVYLYDPNGKAYIDLISGIGVSSIGHGHPRVVEAVASQAAKHMHVMVYGEFVLSPQTRLAKALTDTLPDKMDNVYFVNSGSEAIEAAMKLAKRYTQRLNIVTCKNAYHGATQGALSATGNESLKQAYRPLLPGITHIKFGEVQDLTHINKDTACVLIETVQGEAGVRTTNSSYFKALRDKCNETGALLIMDEIQCGFGRTGKMWAFEHYDFIPDAVVAAKAMGGGMPIGALFAPANIMAVFQTNPLLGHITTFGGHPVSAAASLAALEVMNEEKLLSQVEAKSKLIRKRLNHKAIKSIRSCGLMMAIEFESFDLVKSIVHKALELGVITDWFLFCDNALRIAPPLTISTEEINTACQILLEAIDEIT